MDTFFVWLGAKRAQKQGVGEKGVLLDVATRLRLPVPNGGILLDQFYQLCVQEGVVQIVAGRVTVPQPQALADLLYTAVRFPQMKGKLAVRPLFAGETVLAVDGQVVEALAGALTAVWNCFPAAAEAGRRDLLLMQMVDSRVAGCAVCQPDYVDDWVQVDDNSEPWLLPPLSGRGQPSLPPFAQRLQRLLAGVRRALGDVAWELTWADDGGVCWLLGVRPLPQPPARSEQWTLLTAEPLPLLLGQLLVEVGQSLPGLLQGVDRDWPQERPLLWVDEAKRASFNQSLLVDVARRWHGWGKRWKLRWGWRGAVRMAEKTAVALANQPPTDCAPLLSALRLLGEQYGVAAVQVALARQFGWGGVQLEQGWRDAGLAAYGVLRERLERVAETAVGRGQLPDTDAIWLLTPVEAQALDAGASYQAELFRHRSSLGDVPNVHH